LVGARPDLAGECSPNAIDGFDVRYVAGKGQRKRREETKEREGRDLNPEKKMKSERI